MIRTLMRIGWLNLARDRVAQAMTFILPISFFSIFAMIFGNTGHGGTARVPVAVVDEDHSAGSRKLIQALEREKGLRVRLGARAPGADRKSPDITLDRARAEQMVRAGDLSVALVIPAGFDSSFARFDGVGQPVLLLTDPSDPVAPQVVGGLLQKAAMTASPDALARNGMAMLDRYGGGLTPQQRKASDSWTRMLQAQGQADSAAEARGDTLAMSRADSSGMGGLVKIEEHKVVGQTKDTSMI